MRLFRFGPYGSTASRSKRLVLVRVLLPIRGIHGGGRYNYFPPRQARASIPLRVRQHSARQLAETDNCGLYNTCLSAYNETVRSCKTLPIQPSFIVALSVVVVSPVPLPLSKSASPFGRIICPPLGRCVSPLACLAVPPPRCSRHLPLRNYFILCPLCTFLLRCWSEERIDRLIRLDRFSSVVGK